MDYLGHRLKLYVNLDVLSEFSIIYLFIIYELELTAQLRLVPPVVS